MLKKTHVFFKKVPKTKIFINSGFLSLLVSKIHFLKNNVYRRWRGSDEWFGTRFFHTFHVVFRCVFDFWVFYVFYHVRAKLLWKDSSKQENLVKTTLCLVAPCKIMLNLEWIDTRLTKCLHNGLFKMSRKHEFLSNRTQFDKI